MAALILIVDDEKKYRQLYAETLSESGYQVKAAACADDALRLMQEQLPGMIVSDVRMPGADGLQLLKEVRQQYGEIPFLLVTAFSNVRDAVNALKLGAVDYLEKPIDLDELLAAVDEVFGRQSNSTAREIPADILADIVAEAPSMKSLVSDAYRVAASDATVLLSGESGTGKDVFAKFIFRASKRCQAPFVAVNCAAIPSGLLAAEIFGHQKGAFTGADTSRKGYFRAADGGTVFLDEIGDMPLDLQASMLRVLESGCVTPLGSSKEEPVDFRLIAATNTNLQEAVRTGKFRDDLFYRLNVISFEIPPLRQRPEDINPLIRFFLRQMEGNRRLSPAAARLLNSYAWPGNIRELHNAIERSALLSGSEIILPEHLPPAIHKTGTVSAETSIDSQITSLKQSELATIKKALEQTNNNRTKAAQLLGISRRSLIYKIKQYTLGSNDSPS
ncbi:MAG: sigma-54-dependent Fis family transcriptional regulator [Deltaproteobacteria bacterium]|nr:sigma-54-dependent Fis family transcriptional regulator [Deltaproteobacteria bacterium]